MENLENEEEVNQQKGVMEELPKGGFGVKNIETINTDKKGAKEPFVPTAGIKSKEHLNRSEGADTDASSS